MDKRPPLGPHATVNLGIFAFLAAVKSFALILFASVLATALTSLGELTFKAVSNGQLLPRASTDWLAALAGEAQAQVAGIWLASLGLDPSLQVLLAIGSLGLALGSASDWALNYFAQRAATGAKSQIRSALVERVLATGGIDTPDGTGATAVLISRSLDSLDNYYSKTLTALVRSAVIPLLILLYLLVYDWFSALVLTLTLPLLPAFTLFFGRKARLNSARAQRELLRLSDHIVELVKGLPVLIGLGRAQAQSRALADLGDRYRKTTMYTLHSAFMSSFWLELLASLAMAGLAYLLASRLMAGQLAVDTALLVLFLARECYKPLQDFGAAYHRSKEGIGALRRAQSIIDRPLPQTNISPEGPYLRAQAVSVTYPGRGEILSNVNFRIQHGTTTAITGPSGCGKSTLLGVLSGAVAHGLIPTGAHEAMTVTGSVSGTGQTVWVSQSPSFIANSVLEEVALYGFPVYVHYEEELSAVLNLLSSKGPVTLSRKGRAKYLGYLRVVGLDSYADLAPETLSAGQMRRLAIARTLARVDALEQAGEHVTVLVDEPTAHLDQAAAQRVNISLAALAATGATLLIVTHDLALADRTDYMLKARVDSQGRALGWDLLAGGRQGWDIEGFKRAVRESPIPPAHAGARRQAAPRRQPQPLPWFKTMSNIRSLTKIGPLPLLFPLFLSVLAQILMLLMLGFSAWLLMKAASLPAQANYILAAITGLHLLGLGQALLQYMQRFYTHNLVLRSANRLRVRAWDSAGRTVLSIRSLLRGDRILDRLVGDIDELRLVLPKVIVPVMTHVLVMIFMLACTIYLLPFAVPAVLTGALASLFIFPALVRYTDHRADGSARESTSALLRLGVSAIDAAPDLRANGLNDLTAAAFAQKDQQNVDSVLAVSRAVGFGRGLTTLTWWSVSLWIIALAWTPVRLGQLQASTVAILVFMCTGLASSSLGHIEAVRRWPSLAQLVARMSPLLEVNELQEEELDERSALKREELSAPIQLELKRVGARWPGMGQTVFSGLTASIRSGQWLGITGPSGSGKTTALATLLGFLPVEKGSVTVNGYALSRADLRGYAAWCPQSAYIFESSIANNLALAAPKDQRPSDEQMLAVLDRVGLGSFVRSLPEGLDTQVGAGGSYVSGGQRQRIAIARTLLTESSLLLMDEPTAHLDTLAARALINEVARGTKADRDLVENSARPGSRVLVPPAVVLVSHRAEDIAACDQVVKL